MSLDHFQSLDMGSVAAAVRVGRCGVTAPKRMRIFGPARLGRHAEVPAWP